MRGHALRQSAKLTPSPKYLDEEEFLEPHRRGEILVAAMMNAFVEVWAARLKALGTVTAGHLDRGRVVEEGADAADYLLTMAIRALDYSMPVHMEFRDYLSALLTADREIRPDDSKYRFRDHLRASFEAYGIEPSSVEGGDEPGRLAAAQERPGGLAGGQVQPRAHPLRVAHPRPRGGLPLHLAEPPGAGPDRGRLHPGAVGAALPARRRRTASSCARRSPSTCRSSSSRPASSTG